MKPLLHLYPAFPVPSDSMCNGMTLRDYIAIAAMQAILHDAERFWERAAPLAYEYADAMLEERDK